MLGVVVTRSYFARSIPPSCPGVQGGQDVAEHLISRHAVQRAELGESLQGARPAPCSEPATVEGRKDLPER
jgi:hypothetical protein